ncbi:MAG: NAD(P)-binding domain-containing protein [Clostridia bacterium]|nr:NAD(P)-binding domain-containing protein [Clostridia bacterium]
MFIQKLKVTVCGGDKRYLKTYDLFNKNGFEAYYSNCQTIKNISDTNILVLPIASFDREGNFTGSQYTIYDILNMMSSGSSIFSGKVPTIIKNIAKEYKVSLYDYTDNEEFNILNSISTAEGAILTALKASNKTISQSKLTILGYGRIGRALAVRLKALGGVVKVGARSAIARANALCDNIEAYDIETSIKLSESSDFIFNTIPSTIITEDNINNIKNSIIIDLASIPGGLSENAKIISGENFIHALSLPGKYFPDTAGESIYKTIISILREKGVYV